ncbi:MAG: 4-aminobutyrate--2-oxoglutarate transaminase [Candidatus Nanopelagicaceae bacterium]|nr:4-aminobutyrate--2-oxoglutarate transaminase [Candidatus Nanopelagicaceae bacterium]
MYSEARKPVTQKRNLITAIPGPKSAELLKRRGEAVSASLGTAFPVFIDHSEGAIIVDVDGNSILDLGAGIAVLNVGHSAKEVRENVKRQIDAFTHTCFMVVPYTGYVEVCEALNRLTPGTHKKKSALFNSGAEAIENAVKIARKFTKRSAVVVFEHGYHGRTNLTMAMTAKSMPYKDGFGPFAPEVYRMPIAYPYRCDACTKPCESSVLSMVLHKIEKEIGASNVACIVIEPILGEGGFIVPCKGFLPGLAKFCKENGIVFIADEVQTGFARTGDMFACEDESVIPDLIVTAKGIAAGMPLAGVTGRAEIMDSIHLSGLGGTYGGNPVACAAALGAIEIIERENLAERANKIGKILTDALNAMAKKYPIIGEVRGRGAMQAIELIKPGTMDPNPEALTAILKYCTSKGVLILSAGTYANVIRLLPPLIIEEDLLRDGLGVLDEALASIK